tara:strand:- start:758 stop:1582 length:825 start_codon:yes stop_codon:yes gene_type:complete
MEIIDKNLSSKPIIEKYYSELKNINLKNKPILSIILIGSRQDSLIYVNIKKKKCLELGIICNIHNYDNNVLDTIIIDKINELNNDLNVKGIMVQLPIPKNLDKNKIISQIDPKKDVDGLHPYNLGKIMNNENPYFYPCTPLACITLLEYYNIDIEGKHIVFVGTGMVNLPLSIMLLHKKCSLSLCNEYTENIKEKTNVADILIVACGQSKIIKKDWIKNDCIIIDIGIHKNDGKLNGDVDYLDVIDKVKYITPVPGGVGPLTVCMLIKNLIKNF